MPKYLQAGRPLEISTPLAKDVLLLTEVSGREAISELFRFECELLAENGAEVAFDKLLGQKVTATIGPAGVAKRYISGIVSRVAEGGRDETFTSYRMEVVPQFWLLTRRTESRIFQQMSVPDILKKVLAGLDATYEIQGTFEPRDYCVQYRESDFDFASRLMEEEGIYYFFKHTAGGHTLVLANTPQSHPDIDPSQIVYEEISGGNRPEQRVFTWTKSQELRSGKSTLWDHCFELPYKHLEADKTTLGSVQSGEVSHKLSTGGNDKLELYDYPGGYASRFDGVDRGGGDRPADLQKIFNDNKRTVEIRMQAETAHAILISGTGNCEQFTPGHRFTLERHFNADGMYTITVVEHRAKLTGDYRTSGSDPGFEYENRFRSIPFALPYRPQRVTPVPKVAGAQTAVVVGPSGEEIFTDKYGRVKVQFHWDREGKNDGDSSCWLRVATPWAGKQWGMIHLPRIGQEVLVDFVEGNVNDPIVVGSVYNADQMPPYTLPANRTQSGIKTRSSLKGGTSNFNELRFEDKKGSEQVFLHAEMNQDIEVEKDETEWVGNDRTTKIDHDETVTIKNNRTETIKEGNDTLTIEMGNREATIKMGNDTLTIEMGNRTTTIKMGNDTTKLNLGKSETEAMQSIELKVGQSSVKLDQTGVTIKGMTIDIEGQMQTQVKGMMTQVTATGVLQLQGSLTTIN